MSFSKLLLEIGAEEIPTGYIGPALTQLQKGLLSSLKENRLINDENTEIVVFGTPRRLVAFVCDIPEKQKEIKISVFGPAMDKAKDSDGNWSKAALGFAKSNNVSVEDLGTKEKKGKQHLYHESTDKGDLAKQVLPEMLKNIILSLRFTKSMRWDEDNSIRFARPIRTILALLDKEVIKFSIGDISSGCLTKGHRFLKGASREIEIEKADLDIYLKKMENAGVIVNFEERKAKIINELKKNSSNQETFDDDLIDEVSNLVESPSVLLGSFDTRYLQLPAEVLVTSMKRHQRYFPLHNDDGSLRPEFIFVANGVNKGSEKEITHGNERVLAARLSDAEFFWKEDISSPLSKKVEKLKGVVFQKDVGTYFEKQKRICVIASLIAQSLGLSDSQKESIIESANLCKADLVTNMVCEFPELQGVMGREYALFDGQAKDVAQAIFEHYLPRFSSDHLPASIEGAVLSIADKLDTIVSCFRVGLEVTGSKDPYALRRQGLGIIRISRQFDMSFSINDVVELEKGAYKDPKIYQEFCSKIIDFFIDRIAVLLRDEGVRYDIVNSVCQHQKTSMVISTMIRKALAMNKLSQDPDFSSIVTTFGRVSNILKQAEFSNSNVDTKEIEKSLIENAEKDLFKAYIETKDSFMPEFANGNYDGAIQILVGLKKPVDRLFDEVLVMAPDKTLRNKRLSLLGLLKDMFFEIADFSQIVVK